MKNARCHYNVKQAQLQKLGEIMPEIRFIDNDFIEGTLIRFSKNDTYKNACDVLAALANEWNMRFVKDDSLFGGYYVRPDGVCYWVS